LVNFGANDDLDDLGMAGGNFYDGTDLLWFTLKRPEKDVRVKYHSP
jgi:hypothetical protein